MACRRSRHESRLGFAAAMSLIVSARSAMLVASATRRAVSDAAWTRWRASTAFSNQMSPWYARRVHISQSAAWGRSARNPPSASYASRRTTIAAGRTRLDTVSTSRARRQTPDASCSARVIVIGDPCSSMYSARQTAATTPSCPNAASIRA